MLSVTGTIHNPPQEPSLSQVLARARKDHDIPQVRNQHAAQEAVQPVMLNDGSRTLKSSKRTSGKQPIISAPTQSSPPATTSCPVDKPAPRPFIPPDHGADGRCRTVGPQ
jgi:hypothetical protein